jgi:aryl-alcohol dehydrogenase-like predicted oxidoreductase
VDTADVYVDGVSETIIGRWLADRPTDITERIVLATKGRFPTSGEPNGACLSRRHLDRALTASLRRLGVNTVDLYQVHSWDPLTPVEETLSFLDNALRSGTIRYCGLSNYLGWQIQNTVDTAQLEGLAGPVTLQTGYSLLSREVEWEIVPACDAQRSAR